jgi:hypothetical protein
MNDIVATNHKVNRRKVRFRPTFMEGACWKWTVDESNTGREQLAESVTLTPTHGKSVNGHALSRQRTEKSIHKFSDATPRTKQGRGIDRDPHVRSNLRTRTQ